MTEPTNPDLVNDLATMVRRLARHLSNYSKPNHVPNFSYSASLVKTAMELLKSNNLSGTPLRDKSPTAEKTE